MFPAEMLTVTSLVGGRRLIPVFLASPVARRVVEVFLVFMIFGSANGRRLRLCAPGGVKLVTAVVLILALAGGAFALCMCGGDMVVT